MEAINIIIAKMEGYRKCVHHYDLYSCFDFFEEMDILRGFCESEEQFIEVLKEYDDGRYTLKKDGDFHDSDNPSESESD